MEKTIQGDNQAWNRLSGGHQHNPGNKMEYPSHTNSRGYSGRESHAEGDQVGSDDDDSGDSDKDDRSENRKGGRLGRHCHAYGQVPGQPAMTQPTQSAQQPYQTPPAASAPPLNNPGMPPQQPRAFRRGGSIG